ncbi:MAG TPA: APC family permease [Candidatus Limnocylindria bacterium]|nr:APC family permease [Candidatus Limnocylindria bacterium]
MGDADAGAVARAPMQIFSRQSSGLVRLGSPWRMLLLNVANVGVGYIMFTYWIHPAVFPQSNLLIAILIAAALALPFNLLYGMFASIMPRTGSEYVFLSRTFHPAIGFMASFAAAMSQAFFVGIGGYWIGQFVLGPLFSSYGVVSGNQLIANIGALASTPDNWLILGSVFIWLMAGLNILGLRAYLRFQDLNWVIGAVTGVLLLVIFLFASNAAFVTAWDSYAGAAGVASYQGTLDLAASSGMPTGFSLTDTLGIIAIIWLIAWASTYIGGEVRTPTKTQVRATVGGMLLYAGIAFALFFAITRAVPVEFNQAAAWLSYNAEGVEAYPVFMLYAGLLIDNLLVFLLVAAGLVLWSYLWIPSAMIIATRAMFAWSFDRIAPAKLADVHSKYNSPWVAVLVVAVIAQVFVILYHIGLFTFLTPALAYYFVFWLVALCGVVFPFHPRTRPLLEASSVNWKVAGIPVMALCGAAGLVFFTIGLYFMLTTDLLFLNGEAQLITTALQFILPLGLFFVVRAYRKSQGVPIDAAYRELPPE